MMKNTNATPAPVYKNESLATTANAIAFELRKLAIVPGSDSAPVWTAKRTWEPDTPTHVIPAYYLTRSDGLTLFLVFGSVDATRAPRGRVKISHSRPRFKDNGYVEVWGDDSTEKIGSPEITVSEAKDPAAIAADIARRLLPDCEHVEKLARERIAAYENYANAREALTVRITEACGGKRHANHGGNKEALYSLDLASIAGPIDQGYGTAHVSSDSVNFDIRSVPAEKAVELARFLREHTFAG